MQKKNEKEKDLNGYNNNDMPYFSLILIANWSSFVKAINIYAGLRLVLMIRQQLIVLPF